MRVFETCPKQSRLGIDASLLHSSSSIDARRAPSSGHQYLRAIVGRPQEWTGRVRVETDDLTRDGWRRPAAIRGHLMSGHT